jgi:hypothetical protein
MDAARCEKFSSARKASSGAVKNHRRDRFGFHGQWKTIAQISFGSGRTRKSFAGAREQQFAPEYLSPATVMTPNS